MKVQYARKKRVSERERERIFKQSELKCVCVCKVCKLERFVSITRSTELVLHRIENSRMCESIDGRITIVAKMLSTSNQSTDVQAASTSVRVFVGASRRLWVWPISKVSSRLVHLNSYVRRKTKTKSSKPRKSLL